MAMTLEMAAGIILCPATKRCVAQYNEARQLLAQAAYDRRLAANTSWEEAAWQDYKRDDLR
jgi:hypothetical protein